MSARRTTIRLAASFTLLGVAWGATGCALAQQGVDPSLEPPNVPGLAAPDPVLDGSGLDGGGVVPDGSAAGGVGVNGGQVGATLPGGAALPGGATMDSGAVGVGVRPEASGQPEVLPGVLDSQIKKCWAVPVMTGDVAEGGLARIRVELLPDGSLAKPPAIIDKPAGRLGTTFAESAAAAITKCAPYKLPPESYVAWQKMMIVFDTLDF